MPKLDTKLYDLVAKWFDAPNNTEAHLIQGEAERHMMATGRAVSQRSAKNYWNLIVDLLENPNA